MIVYSTLNLWTIMFFDIMLGRLVAAIFFIYYTFFFQLFQDLHNVVLTVPAEMAFRKVGRSPALIVAT
jgi:hypothetical protein